jgi:hypothetical protein
MVGFRNGKSIWEIGSDVADEFLPETVLGKWIEGYPVNRVWMKAGFRPMGVEGIGLKNQGK